MSDNHGHSKVPNRTGFSGTISGDCGVDAPENGQWLRKARIPHPAMNVVAKTSKTSIDSLRIAPSIRGLDSIAACKQRKEQRPNAVANTEEFIRTLTSGANVNPSAIMISIRIKSTAAGLHWRRTWFRNLPCGLRGRSCLCHYVRCCCSIANTGNCAHRSCSFVKWKIDRSLYMATLSVDVVRQQRRTIIKVAAQSRRAGTSLADRYGLHEAWINRGASLGSACDPDHKILQW
jgi:hypothetical protein